MLHYFINCKTLEDLKGEYKKLMLKYHPDINPNGTEITKVINAEYDIVFEQLKNIHINSQGQTYTTKTNETANEYKDIINRIISFTGCKIEIIGSWIWISGNTYIYKNDLKALNFKWSANKQAWYYHTGEYHKITKKSYSLDAIRSMFGATEVQTEQRELLYA